MQEEVVEAFAQCRSLEEFLAARAPLGLHSQTPRFLHLELDIVNRCNIRCLMCYHSLESTRRVRTTYLSPEDFSLVAARILPHAYHLSLSLGNEPLMSPHFIPILRIAGGHAVPNVNFFTNALLLDDEAGDAIVEHGVTQLCCSIDGATAATYNAIRRDSDFDKVIGNVTRFIARRNAAGSATPKVRFDFVMMQRNVHEMVDLVELAARLGVQQLNFVHLVSYEGLGMEQESLKYTKALSNYWLERALARAADLGLQVPYCPAPFALDDEAAPVGTAAATEANPFLPTPYCPFPFFHISMGPGGHVLPCPYSHGEAPYGQVSADTPIDEIWLGPKFTTLRQRILRHDPPEMCLRCAFLSNRYPDVAALFATRRQ